VMIGFSADGGRAVNPAKRSST